ncbi:MAG: hypothetical protein AAGL98_03050, partial [Planctomycetota bacterium]
IGGLMAWRVGWRALRPRRWQSVLMVVLQAGPFVAIYSLIYYLKPTYLLPVVLVLCMVNAAWLRRGFVAWGRPGGAAAVVIAAAALGLAGYRLAPHDRLPEPLARLSHGEVAVRSAAIAEFEKELQRVPAGHFVMIHQMPAGLTTQTLRLFLDDGHFGKPARDGVAVYDGTWSRHTDEAFDAMFPTAQRWTLDRQLLPPATENIETP